MGYNIILTPEAIEDVQKAIDYYDEQQVGLGRKFEQNLDVYISAIKENPFYQIRYSNVRGFPLKKYPYMIHFIVEGKDVRIIAVFHTSLNSEDHWGERK